jgi:hypothetical protein
MKKTYILMGPQKNLNSQSNPDQKVQSWRRLHYLISNPLQSYDNQNSMVLALKNWFME